MYSVITCVWFFLLHTHMCVRYIVCNMDFCFVIFFLFLESAIDGSVCLFHTITTTPFYGANVILYDGFFFSHFILLLRDIFSFAVFPHCFNFFLFFCAVVVRSIFHCFDSFFLLRFVLDEQVTYMLLMCVLNHMVKRNVLFVVSGFSHKCAFAMIKWKFICTYRFSCLLYISNHI